MSLRLPLLDGRPYAAACPDCPGGRRGVLGDLVGPPAAGCRFDGLRVERRGALPASLPERHAFGLVRRGVLIRQRVDADGRATAIDAAGPGCLVPLEPGAADYAASDLLLCACPDATFDAAVEGSPRLARELIALQAEAMRRVERLAEARGAPTVRDAVGRLLVALSETLSPPRVRARLPSGLQQRDMAKLAGIRHETFCRVLRELEAAGAVERSADGLALLDLERLRAAA